MIAWLILLNDQKCEGKCQEGFEPCGERCGLHKDEEGGEYACPTAESTLGKFRYCWSDQGISSKHLKLGTLQGWPDNRDDRIEWYGRNDQNYWNDWNEDHQNDLNYWMLAVRPSVFKSPVLYGTST